RPRLPNRVLLLGERGFLLVGDADDLEAIAAILAIQADHEGQFGAARAAGGGPEVEQHQFALAVLPQLPDLAVEVVQRKVLQFLRDEDTGRHDDPVRHGRIASVVLRRCGRRRGRRRRRGGGGRRQGWLLDLVARGRRGRRVGRQRLLHWRIVPRTGDG